MDGVLDGIVAFVSAHRAWAPYIVFLLALAETTAFLSLLVPSTAILLGIGALVATGALEFLPVFVGAGAGAIVGSSFSYWLGWRFGPGLLERWPLNRDPALVARGTSAFARWGAASVLLGHFIGPLRSVAFIAAGFSAMRLALFQLANVPGALAWAFVVPKSGELGGDAFAAAWRAIFGV